MLGEWQNIEDEIDYFLEYFLKGFCVWAEEVQNNLFMIGLLFLGAVGLHD